MSSPSNNPSRTQRSDPSRIAPFLTNVVTHHGQLTLIPPQNAGRISRKGGKKALLERARTEHRRDDEPRFNTAAPASPRAANRRANHAERSPRAPPAVPQRFSRDTMIPDYPPPSFQEAMMTPPFIPPTAADVQESHAPAIEPLTKMLILLQPRTSPRRTTHLDVIAVNQYHTASASPSTAGATPTPPSSSHSHSHSAPFTLHTDTPTTETTPDASPSPDSQPGSDTASEDSSIELVSLDTDAYDLSQRLAGPLRCRAARIHRRQHPSHSSSPSHSHSSHSHGYHKDGMQTPRHVAHLSIDVDDAQLQAQERGGVRGVGVLRLRTVRRSSLTKWMSPHFLLFLLRLITLITRPLVAEVVEMETVVRPY
ncbi:hypothetical protein BC629DRAFT_1590642 [Irpex lacteus]|nr:hypothetical protein BC629DRAFT_1590642 [Irpex lacteus]